MSFASVFKLVGALGMVGASVALPFKGYEYVSKKSGHGQAKKPRILLGRGVGGGRT